MTVPAARTLTCSNAIPKTQNTATVLEFRCLYTSDMRRKQKRWQDGRLKYHTFNKRIMVYDDRSNFVGDSHWRVDHIFGEGEEVELERCGILVEVSECVGTREQDLTTLLSRVVKNGQERVQVTADASSILRPLGASMQTQTTGLSCTLPTYLRSAKRRKSNNSPASKNGYAQNLTGATLALSGTPSTIIPLHYNSTCLRTMMQPVEESIMSDSAGINHMPQESPFATNTSQIKTGGSETNRLSKVVLPARFNSHYTRNITGAALVFANKTFTGQGPLKTAAIWSGESGPATRAIEEGEFIDIDVYDENLQVGKARRSSSQVSDLATLRIKTRSKPRLLSGATLSPRPSPKSVPVGDKGAWSREAFDLFGLQLERRDEGDLHCNI